MSRKSENTKEQLTRAAIQLFFEKGFEETTFKDISKKVGVSQPLLYSYYKNKMDLLCECCLYASEHGRNAIYSHIESSAPAPKQLYNYLYGNLNWFHKDRQNGHVILSMYYFAGSHREIGRLFHLSQKTAVERVGEILNTGQKEGHWNGRRLQDKANFIHSCLVGEVYKIFFGFKNASASERAEALMKDCLNILEN